MILDKLFIEPTNTKQSYLNNHLHLIRVHVLKPVLCFVRHKDVFQARSNERTLLQKKSVFASYAILHVYCIVCMCYSFDLTRNSPPILHATGPSRDVSQPMMSS